MAEGGVNHPEHTNPFRIIRLFRNHFGGFGMHTRKSSVGCRLLTTELSDYAFAPAPRKRNIVIVTPVDGQRIHSATRAIVIALAQRSANPSPRYMFGFAGIFGNMRLNCRDQWER